MENFRGDQIQCAGGISAAQLLSLLALLGAAAISGGTSTAAMISCCTHYLANVLPILGATGVVALVGQYQVELFWVGLAFNLAGALYIGSKVVQASRHMAQMVPEA